MDEKKDEQKVKVILIGGQALEAGESGKGDPAVTKLPVTELPPVPDHPVTTFIMDAMKEFLGASKDGWAEVKDFFMAVLGVDEATAEALAADIKRDLFLLKFMPELLEVALAHQLVIGAKLARYGLI